MRLFGICYECVGDDLCGRCPRSALSRWEKWEMSGWEMSKWDMTCNPVKATCGATGDEQVGIATNLQKQEDHYDANFVVTGGTIGWCNNLWCQKWTESWHHNISPDN